MRQFTQSPDGYYHIGVQGASVPYNMMTTAERVGPGFQTLPDAVRTVFSAEILFTALPALKFDPFTTKRTELGQQPGKTIAIPKLGNIRRGGKLIEGERIKTQALSQSMALVTVGERGNAISVSELLLQTSFYDQMQIGSLQLGRDMTIVLDLEIRDAVMMGTNLVRGDTTPTSGVKATSRATTGGYFNTRVIKDAVEILETNNSPKFDGDYYIAFIHPHQARGLRDDPNWIVPQEYAGVTAIFSGEMGRYEDVRFISTTVMPNGADASLDPDTGEFADLGYSSVLDAAGASSVDIYQGAFFGENSIGFALALPTELRDNGVTDFGREHALAWYSIWGTEILENKNVVIAETA
jgi:N4-gp56 family major capsid protein